jgi:hypothetical protein
MGPESKDAGALFQRRIEQMFELEEQQDDEDEPEEDLDEGNTT